MMCEKERGKEGGTNWESHQLGNQSASSITKGSTGDREIDWSADRILCVVDLQLPCTSQSEGGEKGEIGGTDLKIGPNIVSGLSSDTSPVDAINGADAMLLHIVVV
jgi:hypothetical protein